MSAPTERPSPAAIGLVALAALGAPAGGLVLWLTWWSAWSWVGVALLSFSPMVAARLVSRFYPQAQMRPALSRFNNRLVLTMMVYVATLMGTTELYRRGLAAGPLGYLLALLPAIPILGIFALYGRYFREETDEFQRKMVMTSLIWSGAATLCEATVWGFLETFGKAPNVWMWAVPVAFFAQLAITSPLAYRRYR